MSVPSEVDPARNCTLLTEPSLSLALALIVTLAGAVNDAPLAGEVMLTVGGGLLAEFTVMLTPEEVVVAPKLSVAFAVIV